MRRCPSQERVSERRFSIKSVISLEDIRMAESCRIYQILITTKISYNLGSSPLAIASQTDG